MTLAIFPAVEPESGVFPQLQRLQEEISSDPELQANGDTDVQAELLPRRRRNGDVHVGRFYWSARRVDPVVAMGLSSRGTLDCRHPDASQPTRGPGRRVGTLVRV